MVLFRVNGERNSGTNFLTEILKINNFPYQNYEIKGNICKYWKHANPNNNPKNENIVDIFIFRNLDDWLVSMFKNPYELQNNWKNNFELFLNIKQKSNNYWKNENNETLNKDDNGKTIFEIRYYKFKKIMEYKKIYKNIILVNLSYIQKEKNLSIFLNFLHTKYNLNIDNNNYTLNIKHTKNKTKNKNRTYDIDINKYCKIIDINKDKKIEKFINNLTYI